MRPLISPSRLLTVFLVLLLTAALPAIAQVPTTLSYQGRLLANDATGAPASGTVDIVFSIWSESTSGTQLWTESWTGVALSNGVFSVLLGSNGTPLDPADFQGDTSLFLELEIDGETLSPRQQLGSAPFAMVDEPANELQDLELSGSTLSLSGDATSVDLSGFVDTDDQQLSLDTNTLSLDNGGSVDLSGYLDNTDDQALSLSDTTLTLEDGGSVELAALAADLGGPTRTVFVTNGIHPGSSGGVAAFDAICQSEADAAGLSGTFITWASEIGGTNPADRLSSAPASSYVLTDGTEIATSWADLTDGTIAAAINLDATGGAPTGNDLVWSATATDGTPDVADGRDCDAWTASSGSGPFGFRTASDATWTDSGSGAFCGASAHLYCFQSDFSGDSATSYRLELSGATLSLEDASGTLSVDLGGLDDQELSRVADELQLTSNDGTDTVDLSDLDESDEVTSIDTRVASLESELASRVFVTSQSYDGDLGGLTGADAICQSLADAAGLGGSYFAWLSDDTGSPSTRFNRLGSFGLIDGTVVADDWDDLTDGTLQAAINLTELGTVTSSSFVWSNTLIDGSPEGGNDCGDWSSNASGTAAIARPDRTDATWTDESALGGCSGSGNPFYCFEQTNALNANSQVLTLDGNTLQLSSSDGPDTVDLSIYVNTDEQDLSFSGSTLSLSGDATGVDLFEELPGLSELVAPRTVFVSSIEFAVGSLGGLAGADAQCQSLADSAGLQGLYMAWLSDSTGSPSTRFTRYGSFQLVDGTVIADDWDDLTDGTLQNAINIDELGAPGAGATNQVWTNTSSAGLAGANNCTNWSSTSGQGGIGSRTSTTSDWTAVGTAACNVSRQLFCFDQLGALGSDNQQLSLSGNTLQLTSSDGTDSVDLSDFEQQDLSFSGNALELTGSSGTQTVSLDSVIAGDVACVDCLTSDDIDTGAVLGDELGSIYAIMIECDGSCTDMTLQEACDARRDLGGLSWDLEPIGVSCQASISSSGFASCGISGSDNLCKTLNVSSSPNLSTHCPDSNGADAIVTCIRKNITSASFSLGTGAGALKSPAHRTLARERPPTPSRERALRATASETGHLVSASGIASCEASGAGYACAFETPLAEVPSCTVTPTGGLLLPSLGEVTTTGLQFSLYGLTSGQPKKAGFHLVCFGRESS